MKGGVVVTGLMGLALVLSWPAGTTQAQGTFRIEEASIEAVHGAFKAGTLTCRALVEGYLQRIERYDKAGPALNAVQTVNPKALAEADRLDAAYKAGGPVGPLHCVPVLLKDQIETMDMPTTYGSAVFKDFVPQRDATVVTRLKQAGAIILGKATMGEFANGYIGSAHGVTRNAYDPSKVPSGSSSGSGTAIGADFALAALAEDTGGSTRGPAAFNNSVGIRPTVPLVSRFGMMPATPTRDTIGPVTRTVRDAALVLDAIAGYDPNDPVTVYAAGEVPSTYTAELRADGLKGARIGVIRDPMDNRADPESEDFKKVRAVIDRAIDDLRRLGAEIVDPIALPDRRPAAAPRGSAGGERPREAPAAGGGGGGAAPGGPGGETEEAVNAYLAQHPNSPARTLRDILLTGQVSIKRAGELMGALGRTTSQLGYLDTMRSREAARITWLRILTDNRLDAVVYATFDHQPTDIPDDIMTNPDAGETYGRGSNRGLSPQIGFPAFTVPAGFTTDGLPVGLEFLGRPFSEPTLFRLLYGYEQGTRHRRPSPVTPPIAR